MKYIFFLCLFACTATQAQELFVFTEPASNMPSRSLGARLSNLLMKNKYSSGSTYYMVPELMLGANKNLMLHADGFISNRSNSLKTEGGSLYGKYRFYSNDKVHNHFRMAVYARVSYNNSYIQQEEINTWGQNTGYAAGLIATQLLHKVALSATAGWERVTDNGAGNKFPLNQPKNALDYTFSFGKLLLPKQYTSYGQTNMNLMVELLGQTLPGNGKSFMDAAPSLQFIFNSQARVDIGYRQQLYSSLYRNADKGFMLRFEYLFFNAFK